MLRGKRYSNGIADQLYGIRFCFNHHLLARFGLKRLPKNGHPPIWIGKVRVMVRRKDELGPRRQHRLVAECPCCLGWYCAGHIGQHWEACHENH